MEWKKYYFDLIICLCGLGIVLSGLVQSGLVQSFQINEPPLAQIHYDIIMGIGIFVSLFAMWNLDDKIEREKCKCQ